MPPQIQATPYDANYFERLRGFVPPPEDPVNVARSVRGEWREAWNGGYNLPASSFVDQAEFARRLQALEYSGPAGLPALASAARPSVSKVDCIMAAARRIDRLLRKIGFPYRSCKIVIARNGRFVDCASEIHMTASTTYMGLNLRVPGNEFINYQHMLESFIK